MPITVSVDGLSVVTTKSGGVAMATIPDFCKIPIPFGTIPIPLPNIVESKKAKLTSIITKFDGGNICLLGSYCEPSTGDEAGILGGIISGKTKGKGFFLMGSSTMSVEGRPVCRKSDLMLMNLINTLSLTGMNQPDVGDADKVDIEPRIIKIELKDPEGNPVPDERFMIKHSGKVTHEGTLDKNGYAKVEDVHGGMYQVIFPDQEHFEKQ